MFTIKSRLAAAAALPLALALLTGCASGADTAAPDPSQSPASRIADFDDWQLAYAGCMREQGVDVADPGGEGGAGFSVDDAGMEAFAAAGKACRAKLGAPPARDGDQGTTESERQEERLRVASCLRERGYDVADPKPGEAAGLPADLQEDVVSACLPGGTTGQSAGGK